MPRATVVIPTHDHGRLLELAASSALAQTCTDFELVIVGDGATDETRETATALADRDDRVRFLDHPKGPRLGEAYRHAVLAGARGEIVCYLADDDLWLPNHLEVMLDLLGRVDVASARAIKIDGYGDAMTWRMDLADPADRDVMLRQGNRVPLSAMAHTMDAYRMIDGWTTTPVGTATDWYFFKKLLRRDDLRAGTATITTVLHFAQADRRASSAPSRLAELRTWADRAGDDAWRRDELPGLELEALDGGWRATDAELRRVWDELEERRAAPSYRARVAARRLARRGIDAARQRLRPRD
jgi:glycosyltransferase involved in cell wall biosynthesis